MGFLECSLETALEVWLVGEQEERSVDQEE